MNGDLISRSALLAAYDKAHQGPPGGARKLIEDAPEALVRCNDCKHWSTQKILNYRICDRWQIQGIKNFATSGDWFCADGERKDDK